jgi:hypothetical protein
MIISIEYEAINERFKQYYPPTLLSLSPSHYPVDGRVL